MSLESRNPWNVPAPSEPTELSPAQSEVESLEEAKTDFVPRPLLPSNTDPISHSDQVPNEFNPPAIQPFTPSVSVAYSLENSRANSSSSSNLLAAQPVVSDPLGGLPTGTRVGKYSLVRLLGRGGMGMVFEATDPMLNRTVAIKLLPRLIAQDQQAVKHFLREAKATGRLNHPNCVRLYDVEHVDGVLYLVMEFVRGGSLADRLKTATLPWEQAVRITLEICRALSAAHELGLVHRDIKPANILLTEDGTPKLTDFGLAKICIGDGSFISAGSASTATAGTPAYMSPEQCRGEPVDARSDLYSLGMTLYAMLTGRPPFEGPVPMLLVAHCYQEPPDPRALVEAIPEAVVEIFRRATAKLPADRFANAGQMLQALEAVIQNPASQPSSVDRLQVLSDAIAVVPISRSGYRPAVMTPGRQGGSFPGAPSPVVSLSPVPGQTGTAPASAYCGTPVALGSTGVRAPRAPSSGLRLPIWVLPLAAMVGAAFALLGLVLLLR